MFTTLKARKDEGGFSLIELLIVIVVLGVLGGIVVFGVGAFKGDSEQAACAANLKAVQVATSAYTAKVGKAPESIDYLLKYEYLESAPSGIVIVDGKAVAKCETS
ncbi:MAG: prepilin-type N-terminal cleavage/methylation domain-containing protein [Candidatus Nanopelagicales bacterium]